MACNNTQYILQFNNPTKYTDIKLITKNTEEDITKKVLYSWSVDGVCWVEWVDYNTYVKICSSIDSDFFLKIKLNIYDVKVYINGYLVNCYNIYIDSSNIFSNTVCDNQVWDPYAGLDCALLLQQNLADNIICLFGIPIFYFKVSPNQETKDYTFKEYVLHNVVSVKQLKLMLPDGMFPSSKPMFSEFDFDWDTDWEVEVSKTQFAQAFGDQAFPKQRDFIWVPMQKRMYEVNSAYDEKSEGLLYRSTTWKLALQKYQDKDNIDKEGYDEMIQNLIVNNYKELWEGDEEREGRSSGIAATDITNVVEDVGYSVFMSDFTRKYLSHSITFSEEQINHQSLILSLNKYLSSNEEDKIIYKERYCGDEGTVEMILSINEELDNKVLFEIGDIRALIDKNNILFGDTSIKLEYNRIYMIAFRWSYKNFATNIKAIPYKINGNVPVYRRKPEMYYFDFANPISSTSSFNNSFILTSKTDVVLYPYGTTVHGFKLYNKNIDKDSELLKYTTTNENCLINDLVKPVNNKPGFIQK